MKNRTKILLVLLLSLIGGFSFFLYSNFHSSYELGGRDKFELEIGEIFTIKIPSNPSTGFENCWINENKCYCVKKIDQQYNSGWAANIGNIGAGGIQVWTFQATSKGIDTVKITACPPISKAGGCEYFSGDSLRIEYGDSIVSKYEPYRSGDYTFIIIVSE